MSQANTTTIENKQTFQNTNLLIKQYAHWAPRIALGSVFLYHGIGKLVDLEMFSQMMGLPVLLALAVALAETIGGILIITGGRDAEWMTRLGAAMFIPVMVGAIGMVHWGQWAFTATETHPMGGAEFQVTLLLVSIYFVLKGNDV